VDETVSLSGDGGDAPLPGGSIGRFVVEGHLGSGGMGMVVSAFDPALKRGYGSSQHARALTEARGAERELTANALNHSDLLDARSSLSRHDPWRR
jgi:hypothetical protein